MLASARLKSQIVQVRAAAVANYASFYFFWIMQNVQVERFAVDAPALEVADSVVYTQGVQIPAAYR
jgi:hypothetical protein